VLVLALPMVVEVLDTIMAAVMGILASWKQRWGCFGLAAVMVAVVLVAVLEVLAGHAGMDAWALLALQMVLVEVLMSVAAPQVFSTSPVQVAAVDLFHR